MGAPRKEITLELIPLRLYPKDIVAAEKAAQEEMERTQEHWDRSKILREWQRLGRREWENRFFI